MSIKLSNNPVKNFNDSSQYSSAEWNKKVNEFSERLESVSARMDENDRAQQGLRKRVEVLDREITQNGNALKESNKKTQKFIEGSQKFIEESQEFLKNSQEFLEKNKAEMTQNYSALKESNKESQKFIKETDEFIKETDEFLEESEAKIIRNAKIIEKTNESFLRGFIKGSRSILCRGYSKVASIASNFFTFLKNLQK
ncbi:MAG: hypothetical protein AAF443_06490 [Chlamydiota bacterium]